MCVLEANESVNSSPENETVTLVLDYCQNLDLPHLGVEQPVDMYYFSLIYLYCLGKINVTKE